MLQSQQETDAYVIPGDNAEDGTLYLHLDYREAQLGTGGVTYVDAEGRELSRELMCR